MPIFLAIASAAFFLRLPTTARRKTRVDGDGMVLMALASTGLVLVSTWAGTKYDWDSLIIILLIVGTVAAAVLFVIREHYASEPIMPLHLFKQRNFNLTTGAGLITGIAMFGTLAYLPTYLQMVTGANATQAGFLMIPMMAALLITSIGSGQIVSKTGRYKWAPVSGSIIVGVGLLLLSTMTAAMPVWLLCAYLAIMGLGLGLSMQILVLIVQNTFPISQVGVATASNNYFRQIGASLGSAVVGSLFAARLTTLLVDRMPASANGTAGSSNAFTPESVKALPKVVRDIIIGAYNDALTPVFLYMVPLMLIALILLSFIKEVPLATTIKRDALPESLDIDGATNVRLDTSDIEVQSAGPASAR